MKNRIKVLGLAWKLLKIHNVRVWEPRQPAINWRSVRYFSLLWLHWSKVFPRRRFHNFFSLGFVFFSTEMQQIICTFLLRDGGAVLLSPSEATLKTHGRKTHFSLIWHSCLGILFIYMCNTHTHMHAPTRWHAGESHWQQRSGMKRTSAHLHQHTPALCRAVNTAIVFWPHFLLGGDKSLFHSHARNKIQLYP